MKLLKLSILLLTLSLLPLVLATTENRYFRSDTATVNGLTTEILGTSNSATFGNRTRLINDAEVSATCYYWGHRTYYRTSGGVETEITSGVSNLFYRSSANSGWQNVNWSCPQTSISSTDSIVVKVYVSLWSSADGYAWTLLDTWQTGQLGTTIINANPWNFTVWTHLSITTGFPKKWTGAIYFGDSTYDSRILGFKYNESTATTLNLFSSIAIDFNVAHKKSVSFSEESAIDFTFDLAHERALTILQHSSIPFFDFSVFADRAVTFRPFGSIPLGLVVRSFVPFAEMVNLPLCIGALGFVLSISALVISSTKKGKLLPLPLACFLLSIVGLGFSFLESESYDMRLGVGVVGFVFSIVGLGFSCNKNENEEGEMYEQI